MAERSKKTPSTAKAKSSPAGARQLMDHDGRVVGAADPLDDLIEITEQFPYNNPVLPKGDARDAFQAALTEQGIEPDVAYAISARVPASVLEDQDLAHLWKTAVITTAEALTSARPSTDFREAAGQALNWQPSRLYQGLRKDGDPESFFFTAWEERLTPEMTKQFGKPTQSEVARSDPKLIRSLRLKYANNLQELADLVPPAKAGPKVKPIPSPDDAARLLVERRARERERVATYRREQRPKT